MLLLLLACSLPSAPPGLLLVTLDGGRVEPATVTSAVEGAQSLPVLAALSGEGAMYRHAYAVAADPARSHAALLTGRYASELGPTGVIPPQVSTVAEALHAYGYATGLFSAGSDLTAEAGFGQGFDRFEVTLAATGFAATAERAGTWIGEQQGPWFAVIHAQEPGPARGVDDELGRLLVRLRGMGRMDATAVIVVSEPERGGDEGLSETATRVGLVARGPGFRAMGHIDTLVDLRDVAATMVAIGGAKVPAGVTGRDIRERDSRDGSAVIVEGSDGSVAIRDSSRRLVLGPGGERLYESPLMGAERPVDDPAAAAALRAAVEAWRGTLHPEVSTTPALTPEAAADLQKHGYWDAGGAARGGGAGAGAPGAGAAGAGAAGAGGAGAGAAGVGAAGAGAAGAGAAGAAEKAGTAGGPGQPGRAAGEGTAGGAGTGGSAPGSGR